MSTTIIGEKWDSRNASISWQNKKADLKILLFTADSDDDLDVSRIGDSYSGSFATEYNLICQGYDMEPLGGGYWLLIVHYANREPQNPGDSVYNFDTGGGTQKITQSIASIDNVGEDGEGTAPNHHGAIGVTSDGIDGCDIVAPKFNWSETHQIPIADVTSSYQLALSGLTGTVNDSTWRGYDTGTVLFLGASGTQRGLDAWEITYKFEYSPNALGITIGDLDPIDKLGWDYLWVLYKTDKDVSSAPPSITRPPVAVYTEAVYEDKDFSEIGIGS